MSDSTKRSESGAGHRNGRRRLLAACLGFLVLAGCADADVPGARNVTIPAPVSADQRKDAINEKPDSVMYLPLGDDVLVPRSEGGDGMPTDPVGPFELRSETLAGALQLILADYDIPLAFESDEGLSRTITVANLHGPLDRVVRRVCGLADLYCSYEDGLLVVKEIQTFTVSVPPVGGDTDIIDTLATGLQAITGKAPIVDKGTRTIVYTTTERTAEMAERYFQRIRSNTALIVFEIYIWEVSLNAANSTGINWRNIAKYGKYEAGINIVGSSSADFTPVSIGLPTTGDVNFATGDVLEFISDFGAVKTISQPQLTVLSGSQASLRVADTTPYVSSLERTVDNGEVSVSTETDTVDTGFTLTIDSSWDNASIYGTIEINLQEFRDFEEFDAGDGNTLQLPQTTERELKTQVRIRPGDSLLIAGLVRENDEFSSNGPGFMKPLLPTSRTAGNSNVELVFLMRPRVIAYTTGKDKAPRPGVPARKTTDRPGFMFEPSYDINPQPSAEDKGSAEEGGISSYSGGLTPPPVEAAPVPAPMPPSGEPYGAPPPGYVSTPVPSAPSPHNEREEGPVDLSVPADMLDPSRQTEEGDEGGMTVDEDPLPLAPADIRSSITGEALDPSSGQAKSMDYAPAYKNQYPDINAYNPYLKYLQNE